MHAEKVWIPFLFIVFFTLLCFSSHAQSEEIPDYRNKREGFSKIADKDIRNDLSAFTLGGIVEGVSKEPLQKLPVTNYGNDFITFTNATIDINIKSSVFFKTQHRLMYYDEKYLVRIDNKPYWGIYGQVPKKTLESIIVIIDRDTISIPPVAYVDIYEPWFCQTNSGSNTAKCNCAVYLSNDNRKIYIYMLNSPDGTTGYEVTWVIQDKQYLRRVVDYGF